MGQLIVTEFMSVDGIAQAPGGRDEDREGGFAYGGWQMPLEAPEADGLIFEQACAMDALLLGRRTYEIFADYWPTAPDMGFSRLLNGVPKYVASRTLADPLGWSGSRVLQGDVAEGVSALKERHERVHVIGSLDLLQSLLAEGLVDRLNLWVYPVILGSGKRVFTGTVRPSGLRPTLSRVFGNGSLQLEYELEGHPATTRET